MKSQLAAEREYPPSRATATDRIDRRRSDVDREQR